MNSVPYDPGPVPRDAVSSSVYAEMADAANTTLDVQLQAIRDDLDNGDITVREAADERIQVMEEHRARLVWLRAEYLGGE